jgi:hypothetical protein
VLTFFVVTAGHSRLTTECHSAAQIELFRLV